MKLVVSILLLMVAVSVSAQTNQNAPLCCRHPLRTFGGQGTVNLTPLFQWWTHRAAAPKPAPGRLNLADALVGSARPLAAWHRLTGTKAAALEYDWVVNAVIYTSPTASTNARIILKNPPVAEEQAFYDLKNQIAAAGQQITNDQRAYQAHTKAAQKDEARAGADSRSRNLRARLDTNNYREVAAQERAAATAAQNDQKQCEQTRAVAQKQLAAIPAAKGQYQIDCFALELGLTKDGVPIYDVGVVDPNSP
jgi:hypothetical protein